MNRNIVVFLVAAVVIIGGLIWGFTMVNQSIAPNLQVNPPRNVGGGPAEVIPEVKTFEVIGRFIPDQPFDQSFEFNPKEIRVKQGDVVRINFKSTLGMHDWKVDKFNSQTRQIQTGESADITFVADRKGEFTYYCSVGDHRARGMVGKLIVE